LNRYAYANNSPINFNDPTGHCPTCIGAGIGAIAGVLLYSLNVSTSGQHWDPGQAFVAAGVGALAGSLIGTGFGAAAGVEALASISAGEAAVMTSTGIGIGTSAGGYTLANTVTARDFDSFEFGSAAATGAIAGSLGQTWATTVPRVMILNAGTNLLDYEANSIHQTGRPQFDSGAGIAMLGGVASGAISGPYTPVDNIGQTKFRLGVDIYKYDLKIDPVRFRDSYYDIYLRQFTNSAIRDGIGSFLTNAATVEDDLK
jgi:hypothetical protein